MTGYRTTFRRMLLDMHIPDWDPSFLTQYDRSTSHRSTNERTRPA